MAYGHERAGGCEGMGWGGELVGEEDVSLCAGG